MASVPDPDLARPCPACGGAAEPEQDGDHRYHECPDCGFAFGWNRVETTTIALAGDDRCALGVPEGVRRRASAPAERALATQPLIQITRRPDASAP